MREIKFRAWDRLKQTMITIDGIRGDMGFKTTGSHDQFYGVEYIMQYTGLKDKNGNEIYEGDILRRNNNDKDLVQVKFGEFLVYELETEKAIEQAYGWYLKVIPTDELSKLKPFCYDAPLNKYWVDKLEIEVIGNIYENKHLLEVENE